MPTKKTLALLGGLLLLASCHSDTQSIQAAAQGYLDALGNYRPTEARPYATPQTCDVTLAFYEYILTVTDSAAYADNMPATITLVNISLQDTTAQVSYHKSTPTTEQDGTLKVVKRDGKWLVNDVIEIPPIIQSAMNPCAAPGIDEETIAEMRRNASKNKSNKVEAKN